MDWAFDEEPAKNAFDVKGFQQVLKNSSKGLRPVDLVAREVVQNSWDAYQWGFPQGAAKASRLRIQFRFSSLRGQAKAQLLDAMAWDQLLEIRENAESSEAGASSYREIAEAPALSVLVASDWGAPGLYHPLSDPGGNWRLALFKLFGGKTTGLLGGSFGVGKTAFLKAGRVPVLGAYTCFAQQPGFTHTRRGQALAYWWNFKDVRDGRSRLGLGCLSAADEDSPALDEEADEWARNMGLVPRNPSNPEESGLDLLLLGPQFSAADLKLSLENFWWPAIASNDFDIEIIENGETVEVDPYERRELEPFLDTYKVMKDEKGLSSAGPDDKPWEQKNLGKCLLRPVATPASSEVHGPIRWASHQVAMIRNTHMVLWYEKPRMPGALPAVQGCYLMEEEEGSRLLRETEPGYHDKWETVPGSQEGDPKAYAFAEKVLKAVRDHARVTFKAWTSKEADEFDAPKAARALAKALLRGAGIGGGTTTRDTLPVEIQRVSRTTPSEVKHEPDLKEGSCVFAAMWGDEKDPAQVVARATARVVAGDGTLGPRVPCIFTRVPEGFERQDPKHRAVGSLRRTPGQFGIQFGPYPAGYEVNVRLEFREA